MVAWAEAEMKVLPRFKKLVVEAAPTSVVDSPDALTRLHRFATEDPFRFKDYASGDDTRRIHWRLSIRAGNLQVRVPESRETHSKHILLILDTWMDPSRDLSDAIGRGRILDDLVEAWLALAAALVLRGTALRSFLWWTMALVSWRSNPSMVVKTAGDGKIWGHVQSGKAIETSPRFSKVRTSKRTRPSPSVHASTQFRQT